MDIQSAAAQLITALGNNPELVSQFAKHPYSTTATVTGTNEHISKQDMSRILTQVAAQASGQKLGTTDTKDLASALLGQSGGSVHGLASALFGGAKPQPTQNQPASSQSAPTGGVDLSSVLSSLGAGASTSSSGGPSMAEIAAKSIAGAVAARGMAALITSAMNANKKDQQGQ